MMKFIRRGAVISLIAAVMLSASAMAADSSTVSLTTSDGANISFKNSSGDEIEKSIDEIILNEQQQSRKGISRVITVKSESPKLIPTDIYIRVSAPKKSTAEKFNIEITDSSGENIKASPIEVIEGENGKLYAKDIYLGCFNSKTVTETKIYTLIAEADEEIGLSIVSDPRRSTAVQTEGIRTIKSVGSDKGQISPGMYYISTAKQLQISAADGTVTHFKAAGTAKVPELVYLNDGDTIEYYSVLYLTAKTDSVPLGFNSFLRIAPGYCTDISEGEIRVYNEDGRLKSTGRSALYNGTTAYMLNHGSLKTEEYETVPQQEITELVSGKIYTVGAEIGVGDYTGVGEGTVRVYDNSGYAKTVIKLKKENSDAEGVESYVFKLSEGETFVVEGDIEFRK